MQWTAEQLVRLAKRESNNIRPYLFVNPLQGKHIPTSPDHAAAMCRELAGLVHAAYPEDRLFMIGFAETATGIAACVSSFLDNVVYYQNTTREQDGSGCLLFSEVHSHATDQFLRTAGLETALKSTDRVIFLDDEVTTGNTICNLIRMLQARYPAYPTKYTILSVLNSMSESRMAEMRSQGIDCLFLCRIPHEYRKDSIMDVCFDPQRHIHAHETGNRYPHLDIFCPINARNTVCFPDYLKANQVFAEEVRTYLLGEGTHPEDILVLGTEEFMYPTFVVGEMLRQQEYTPKVRIHSTTRSPITASGRDGYPLTCRYQIRSPYDEQRTTYVYNLRQYDRVLILTDAGTDTEGILDLCGALEEEGNREITIIRWSDDEHKESI